MTGVHAVKTAVTYMITDPVIPFNEMECLYFLSALDGAMRKDSWPLVDEDLGDFLEVVWSGRRSYYIHYPQELGRTNAPSKWWGNGLNATKYAKANRLIFQVPQNKLRQKKHRESRSKSRGSSCESDDHGETDHGDDTTAARSTAESSKPPRKSRREERADISKEALRQEVKVLQVSVEGLHKVVAELQTNLRTSSLLVHVLNDTVTDLRNQLRRNNNNNNNMSQPLSPSPILPLASVVTQVVDRQTVEENVHPLENAVQRRVSFGDEHLDRIPVQRVVVHSESDETSSDSDSDSDSDSGVDKLLEKNKKKNPVAAAKKSTKDIIQSTAEAIAPKKKPLEAPVPQATPAGANGKIKVPLKPPSKPTKNAESEGGAPQSSMTAMD